jgi:hypothetical protein
MYTMPTANRRRAPAQQNSFLSAVSSNSWLIGIIVMGLINLGMNYQSFGDVKKTQGEQKAKQEEVAASLVKFREDQIRSMGDVSTIKNNMQALDNNVRAIDGRVLVIERTFIEPNKKAK